MYFLKLEIMRTFKIQNANKSFSVFLIGCEGTIFWAEDMVSRFKALYDLEVGLRDMVPWGMCSVYLCLWAASQEITLQSG